MKTKLTTTKPRATVIAPATNGHSNGHSPKVKLEDVKQILIELDKLPKTVKGHYPWKVIKTEHGATWKKLTAYAKPNYLSVILQDLRDKGLVSRPPRLGKRKAKNAAKETAAPVKALTLQFCPHCAFPIGPVIKAVNALNTVRGGGN